MTRKLRGGVGGRGERRGHARQCRGQQAELELGHGGKCPHAAETQADEGVPVIDIDNRHSCLASSIAKIAQFNVIKYTIIKSYHSLVFSST